MRIALASVVLFLFMILIPMCSEIFINVVSIVKLCAIGPSAASRLIKLIGTYFCGSGRHFSCLFCLFESLNNWLISTPVS